MANCLKKIINAEDNDIIITWGGRYREVEQSILGINNANIYGVWGEPSFYHNAGHSDNPGLYIFGQVLHKISFKDSIPFLIALAFTYLPGVLVVPYTYYLVGLISMGSVMFIFYSDKYLSIVENEDKYKYSSSIYFYGALLYLFFCIFYLQKTIIDSGYIKMLLINLLK
ncbi:hypothetical protein CRV03_03235 [Arcobacter sp. F155]|uniref:hypothetical protein n=1 Tax=Arcobacter sp. F155 TaxID=2044512 RepID=UPI00100AC064|nr:hypothetical protein [Arcobacter sp. F155]RXJ77998.1 hypothetical protein CRV03_03235 [Arcobacter sp. F155]